MCERPPTEIDQLLPTPVTDRKSYYSKKDDSQSRRRRCVIFGAVILALVFSFQSVLLHRPEHHRGKDKSFKPKEQRGALQHLTESSLLGATKSHHHSHPEGKINVVVDKQHKHKGDDILHCTSQVMIMRHCDKQAKIKIHGKSHTTDTIDKHGNRHCSAKGKERSEYIATLFVDPHHYQKLVKNKEVEDGIPPVPFIKSSLAKISKAAAPKKPQFPTPLKLYALASERPAGKPSKKHENFREIETITPLSEKFHLDVDESFGVGEEGDLASDFFESLSKSVTEHVDMMTRSLNATDSSSSSGGEGSEISNLCNNGMTVVNWKHSRIPILARALGCGTDEGCPKKYKGHDFDTVWIVTFQYSLLLGRNDELDVDSSLLALESLPKSSSQGSLRHHKKKSHSVGDGNWKITAELVNEGFDPN